MGRWMKVARRVSSSGVVEVYGWIDVVPMMRQWTAGDREVRSVAEQAYQVGNDTFESTIGVKANSIKDDMLGMYTMIMEDLGEEGELHIDRGTFHALRQGRTTPAQDAKNFFATDHLVNSDTDRTGTNTPTSNIINPAVTSGPEWYLICAMGNKRPIIYQEREALRFDSFVDMNDSQVFMRDQYMYGIYARRAWGFSRWQYAVSSRDALTRANYQAAIVMMQSFKRDGGDPWGIQPTLLVVPPALRAAAREILVAERLANGASNTEFGTADLHVEPLLAA